MSDVTYDSRAVRIDGKRRLIFSGAIHYPRSTPEMWPEMMKRSVEAGLNAVETYVFWNLHEERRRVYDFSGRLDLIHFCELAQEHGLYVVLRVGPYICAETNYGGFPAWLKEVPGMEMRTDNEPFMKEMETWVRLLCNRLKPMFAPQGGPIILLQLENEYAIIARNYGAAGERYLKWVVDLSQNLDVGVPLIMCFGSAPGAIETINDFLGHRLIDKQLRNHPDQPALWTENWPGWYDVWGQPHHVRTPENVAYGVARFFAEGGTGVNYYMWHGGTNFAREAMFLQTTSYDYDAPLDEFGLETTKSNHAARLHSILNAHESLLLQCQCPEHTSINEYVSIHIYRDDNSELAFLCNDHRSESATARYGKQEYKLAPESVKLVSNGKVLMDTARVKKEDIVCREFVSAGNLIEIAGHWDEPMPGQCEMDVRPLINLEQPAEQLQFTRDRSDYCWYETTWKVSEKESGPRLLTLKGVADIAHVFLDGKLVGTTGQMLQENRGPFNGEGYVQKFQFDAPQREHRLSVLCCAIGLIKGDWMIGDLNMVEERKGFWGSADWQGRNLPGPWKITPALLGENLRVYDLPGRLAKWNGDIDQGVDKPLTWWQFHFDRPTSGTAFSVDLSGMNKGMIWLNGHCLGRYWLIRSPEDMTAMNDIVSFNGAGEPSQRYYHCPIEWMQEINELVLFEEVGGDPHTVCLQAWKEKVIDF